MIDLIIKHGISIEWHPKIVYARNKYGREVGVKRAQGDSEALEKAVKAVAHD